MNKCKTDKQVSRRSVQLTTAANLALECNCRQMGLSCGRDRIVCARHWPIRDIHGCKSTALAQAGTHRLRPSAACMVRDLSERCLNRDLGGGRYIGSALTRCMSDVRPDAICARNDVGRAQQNVQRKHSLHVSGARAGTHESFSRFFAVREIVR